MYTIHLQVLSIIYIYFNFYKLFVSTYKKYVINFRIFPFFKIYNRARNKRIVEELVVRSRILVGLI